MYLQNIFKIITNQLFSVNLSVFLHKISYNGVILFGWCENEAYKNILQC